MPVEGRTPWRRLLIEGVVIVSSILLAFGIEAWWDERGQATQREALLLGLAADFEVAEARMDTIMMAHEAVFQATSRWLDLSRGSRPEEGLPALADSLVSNMIWTLVYNPPTGSVESLVASGNMSLLESPELASALTSWIARVEELRDWEQVGAENFDRDFAPYLREIGIPLGDLTWYPWDIPRPFEPSRTEVYQLLDDTTWESLVTARWYNYSDVIQYAAPVAEAIDTISEMIEWELSR